MVAFLNGEVSQMNIINKDGLANASVLTGHMKNEGYSIREEKMIVALCELLELAYYEGKTTGFDEGIKATKSAASELLDFFKDCE